MILLLALLPSFAFGAFARPDTVAATLEAADADLSSAERAEKYEKMSASAFAFYRGSAALFWMDLADAALLDDYGGGEETWTLLAGDAHTANVGAFQDDHGDIVFALDDLDEAVVGDYQLDVLRLATSLALVAREVGVSDEEDVIDAFAEAYLDAMADFAAGDDEASLSFTTATTGDPVDDFLRDVADTHSRTELLDEWTSKVSGKRRFDTVKNLELASVSDSLAADVAAHMSAYRATLSSDGVGLGSSYFKVKSVAERLNAGLGSVGSTRYYVLIEGPSTGQGDDRILDLKAQPEPSAWGWLSAEAQAATLEISGGDEARRVALAMRALGRRVDDLVGWVTLSDGQTYSVRERSPYKESFPTETLTEAADLLAYAETLGQVLAAHHARADEDWDPALLPADLDAAIDARTDGDHEGFRALMTETAIATADQVELDYLSFLDWSGS